jgi:hypothetical protein
VIKIPNRWLRCGRAEGRNLRLSRFRQILLSARRTHGYRPALDLAGLSSPRDVARLRAIEEGLHKLPYMEWRSFRGSPAEFRNSAAPPPALAHLRYPANRRIRTAVVGLRIAESDTARMFHPGWTEQIRQFEPEAIAAPVGVLKRLAASASYKGRSSFPTLTRAVIVFTGIEHGTLSPSDRNMLWQAFEVPIFEQYLAPDGSVVAWECEAHEGLHTVEENAIVELGVASELILTSLTDHRYPAIRVVTPLTASLQEGTCGCGQSGPRVTGLAARSPRRELCYAFASGGIRMEM